MIMENYEEKYNEALKNAKQGKPIEEIFPELKESEDEKIRKELIEYHKIQASCGGHNAPFHEKYVSWLEKQGEHANFRNKIQIGDKVTRNEDGVLVNLSQLNRVAKKNEKQGGQKPTKKIEPKFKVGDWIINPKTSNVLQIKNILLCGNKGNYEFDNSSMPIGSVDEHYKQWTIQDAKDGDVLAIEWNQDNDIWEKILIFKALNDNGVEGYGNTFKNKDLFFIQKVPYYSKTWSKYVCPATKEQRDLLFSKMKESGYEWDDEKKELKKIEPAWSNIDEQMLEAVLYDGENALGERHKEWIKNLKYRVQPQPKQEWSEEDKENIEHCIRILERDKNNWRKSCHLNAKEEIEYDSELQDWLRYLQPPYYCDDCKLKKSLNWKPSEKQIIALRWVLNNIPYNTHKEVINEMVEQLKTL